MRSQLFVVGLIGLLTGCATDGESWARSTLGSEGAELIRRDAASHLVDDQAGGVEANPSDAYVRRPLVILEADSGEVAPHAVRFLPLNSKLPDGMRATNASEVRGIVVVQKSMRCKDELTPAGVCEGDSGPRTRLTLVDRDRNLQVLGGIDGDGAVIAYLSALPQSSETASR